MPPSPTVSKPVLPETKVVAHKFHEGNVGKTLSSTKKRYEWHISIGDVKYEVCFTQSSLSGKRAVLVNQKQIYQETVSRGANFTHSWSLDGHSLSILPKWAMKDEVYRSFDLSVDGRPFDVLLNSAGREELGLPSLKIEIIRAKGVPGAGKVDPYCTCEIPGAHGSMFSTKACNKTSDPVWNHEHVIADYVPGEPLKFCVVDKTNSGGMFRKSESSIGEGTLSSEQFYPFGFDGDLRMSSPSGKFSLKVKVSASDTPEERLLRDIFDRCDMNQDGSLNKRELIKALRVDEDVADFFNLPQNIRQEDGSRDEMERIFQEMDTNSDREVSWEEFQSFFARKSKAGEVRSPRSGPGTPTLASASPRGSVGGRSPRSHSSPRRANSSPSFPSAQASASPKPPSASPRASPDQGRNSASDSKSPRPPAARESPRPPARERSHSVASASPRRERAATTAGGFLDGNLEPPKSTSSRRSQSDFQPPPSKKDKKTKSPKFPSATAFDDLGAFGGFNDFETGGSSGTSQWPQDSSWPTEEPTLPQSASWPGFESASPTQDLPIPQSASWAGFESASPTSLPQGSSPKSSPQEPIAPKPNSSNATSSSSPKVIPTTTATSASSSSIPLAMPPSASSPSIPLGPSVASSSTPLAMPLSASSPCIPLATGTSTANGPVKSATGGEQQPAPALTEPPSLTEIFNSNRGSPYVKSAASPMENPVVRSMSSPKLEKRFGSMSEQRIGDDKKSPQDISSKVPSTQTVVAETGSESLDPEGNFAQAQQNLFSGFQENGWPQSPLQQNRPRANTAPVGDFLFGERGNSQSPGSSQSGNSQSPLKKSLIGSPQIPLAKSVTPSPRPFHVPGTSPSFQHLTPLRMRAQTDIAVDPWGNKYSPSLPAAKQTVVVDPWGYKYAK